MRSQARLTSVLWVVLAAGFTFGGGGAKAAEDPRVIRISAKRFEFNPREITLTEGETVKLELTTEDVAHGFFVKPLGIDADIVAGKATEVLVTPRKAGRYTTICDHFCGAGHGNMKMTIVVEPAAPGQATGR